MGFKSVDWADQVRFVLFYFAFNVPLVEFTSMISVIILHE